MIYLAEKNLPAIEDILDVNLPKVLFDFYTEVKKKDKTPRKNPKKNKSNVPEVKEQCENIDEYKNSSLKCMRAALNRYFIEKRGINIITNERFLQANEMFRGVTKKARREGRDSSEHKEAINEDEMKTLSQYFTKNMQGSLNGRHLQEIVLFNIIYFIGRRGRENLRLMTKNTFKVSIDPKERKYIH